MLTLSRFPHERDDRRDRGQSEAPEDAAVVEPVLGFKERRQKHEGETQQFHQTHSQRQTQAAIAGTDGTHGGKYGGHFQGVFAILIGMFAAVIAGCMMLSLYVWPHLPALYTT